MEDAKAMSAVGIYRVAFFVFVLSAIGGLAFAAGLVYAARSAHAAESSGARDSGAKAPRVVYPKKSEIDLGEARIDGELRNPGEFYFQHRNEEKFDSLVKRRKNFHREMLRDAILSR